MGTLTSQQLIDASTRKARVLGAGYHNFFCAYVYVKSPLTLVQNTLKYSKYSDFHIHEIQKFSLYQFLFGLSLFPSIATV
jgi:hypothetical protein